MKKISFVFAVLISVFAFSSCVFTGEEIMGDGNIITKDFKVTGNFSQLDVSSAFDIELIQSNDYKVTVVTDENIMEHISVSFDNDELEVSLAKGFSINPSQQMKLIVSAPQFSSLELSGVSNVTGAQEIKCADGIEFKLSGASGIDLNLQASEIDIKTSGVGTVSLSGKTDKLEISASGASNIHCYDLNAQDVEVTISGAGTANVQVNGELHVKISGAGSVNYKGSPTLITKELSGVGNLNKVE